VDGFFFFFSGRQSDPSQNSPVAGTSSYPDRGVATTDRGRDNYAPSQSATSTVDCTDLVPVNSVWNGAGIRGGRVDQGHPGHPHMPLPLLCTDHPRASASHVQSHPAVVLTFFRQARPS
jgi:hypothetical protein